MGLRKYHKGVHRRTTAQVTFAVADDGISSDVPVTDGLRSRARQPESAKRALDLFIGVVGMACTNPSARELPRIGRQPRRYARWNR
jgi:hypothetical protein